MKLKKFKNVLQNGQKTSRARKQFLTFLTKLMAVIKLDQK